MKKIALITTNKLLAQSLASAIKGMPSSEFEPFLLLNPNQALMDAEIFNIDIALIDVRNSGAIEKESPLFFYQALHDSLPNCHLLLLVSQDDQASRKMAAEAKERSIVDDFVFYDASLKYLLAKLASF